jgi:hypothetical protein
MGFKPISTLYYSGDESVKTNKSIYNGTQENIEER